MVCLALMTLKEQTSSWEVALLKKQTQIWLVQIVIGPGRNGT
jgi:hypothetical protein